MKIKSLVLSTIVALSVSFAGIGNAAAANKQKAKPKTCAQQAAKMGLKGTKKTNFIKKCKAQNKKKNNKKKAATKKKAAENVAPAPETKVEESKDTKTETKVESKQEETKVEKKEGK